jgi:hypothetical protein
MTYPSDMKHKRSSFASRPGEPDALRSPGNGRILGRIMRALIMGLLAFSVACGARRPTSPTVAATPMSTIALPPAEPSPTISITLAPTQELPSDESGEQSKAMLPNSASDVDMFPDATRYDIKANVTFDAEQSSARIQGQARIRFTNPLPWALDDLILMLWPNDEQYRSTMTAGPALIDGVEETAAVELDGVALRFTLSKPLDPGSTVDVSIPFEVIASGPIGGSDPKRFGITNGMFAAPTFYPLVPALIDREWSLQAAPPGGDTTNSDIAFYHVELTFPSKYVLAASGRTIAQTDNGDGTTTDTIVTGPMRDFAFALGPFVIDSRDFEDIQVNAWVLPDHTSDLPRVLDLATDQMRVMSQDVGPYPYTELDVVDAPGAFGGIEYPGLVFIGTLGTSRLVTPVVHEVAHQWFYGLIGNDQLEEPWLDEAAATYAELLYYEGTGDTTSVAGMLSQLRSRVRSSPDPGAPIGQPVGEYSSTDEYFTIVYLKGALFFDALRNQIGDSAFFDFLHVYYSSHLYGFVTSDDFEAAAETACGCQLEQLFEDWVFNPGVVP